MGGDVSAGTLDPAVWTSRNLGRQWSRIPTGPAEPGNQVFLSIARKKATYVAVGYSSDPSGRVDAAIWWSRDTRSWTRVNEKLGAFRGPWQEAKDVIATDRGFIAVGRATTNTEDGVDAAVWSSPTGRHWTRVDNPTFARPQEQEIWSVVRHRSGFLAGGYDSVVGDRDAALWYSRDGVSWERVPSDESVFGGLNDQAIYSLDSQDGLVVAAGVDGSDGGADAAIWLSLNGRGWRRMPSGEEVLGGDGVQEIRGVTITGNVLVAVGADYEGGDADAAVWNARVVRP